MTIDDLIALTIPEIQKMFLKVMQDVVDTAVIEEMIMAIEAGDLDALVRASGFTLAALAPIVDAIEQSYYDGAIATTEEFPARIRTPAGTFIFRFDIRNPVVEKELRDNSSVMITRISQEIRDNIRSTLERGQIAGNNPRKTALDIVGRIDPVTKKRIGGVIGLTTSQEKWAANAQKYLNELDDTYFSLTLRDRRFDKLVQKAIETKKPLKSEDVSRITTSYKNRALKYRADMIARTEAIQSINRGQYRSITQMIEETGFRRSAVTKKWDDTGDKRTRTSHAVMGTKYGKQGIDLEEAFVSPFGARLLYPGDTSLDAPAAEIIHCRCRIKYDIDWIAGRE